MSDFMQFDLNGHVIDKVEKMDLNKYTEKKVEQREKGTKGEDVVERIETGTLASLTGALWEKYNKDKDQDPETPAIKVFGKTGANKMIRLPEGKEYHPKSTFGLWVAAYGKPPHVGQKIDLIADSKGYWQIRL